MSATTIQKPVILGAGQLALAIMDELVTRQIPVTLVNRSGRVKEALPPGVTVVQADLYNAQEVARVCAGADVVFLCAQPAYTEWPEKFPPLVESAITGLTGSAAKLLFGDNLYCYGSTGGAPIHEELPYAATGRKGRTRAHMAKMLLDAHRQDKVQVAIGRASDFYGPRATDSALGAIVFVPALEGKTANVLGNPDLPHTYSYIRDFARGLLVLAEHDEAVGQVWHIPNAPTITTRQMLDLIGQEVGRPVKVRAAGRWLLNLMALFNPTLREMKEMAYEFEEPYIVDSSRFVAAFGDIATPHVQAIRDTVAWYRQHLHAAASD